jgi:hypothetical protein
MTWSLSHLSDGALLRDLATLVARDRATTAALLAHLAEVDRGCTLPPTYPSCRLRGRAGPVRQAA